MPIEPPVTSPRDLAERLRDPRRGGSRDAGAADRRRHGPDGRPDRRAGRATGQRRSTCGPSMGCAASPSTATRCQPRRPDDVHRDPPLAALPRARPGPGRGGRDDRCRPDPEPRHARRQHRQRLAGRRHAAGPARRRCRRSSSARRGASARSPAADFWTGYRQTALAHDELVVRIRIPLGAGPRDALPQGRHAPRPVDQQGRDGGRVAAARTRAAGVWRDVRVALGSVAATPIRAARTEAVARGLPRRRRRPPIAPRRPWPPSSQPIDDVRSTAGYRRVVAARILHRIVREAGGW